jgi:hypothetical protein
MMFFYIRIVPDHRPAIVARDFLNREDFLAFIRGATVANPTKKFYAVPFSCVKRLFPLVKWRQYEEREWPKDIPL